jgi:hypothetical protein
MNRIPVFDVKKVKAVSEHPLLMFLFDPKPLPCVHTSKALL